MGKETQFKPTWNNVPTKLIRIPEIFSDELLRLAREWDSQNLERFGKTIQEGRRRKGYSQRKLADLIGVNHTYLSKIENNQVVYAPTLEIIESLANHLKLDAKELGKLAGRISG